MGRLLDFILALVLMFISFWLGDFFGVRRERKKQQQEQEERNHESLKALKFELEENYRILKGIKMIPTTLLTEVKIENFKTETWKKFHGSFSMPEDFCTRARKFYDYLHKINGLFANRTPLAVIHLESELCKKEIPFLLKELDQVLKSN